MVLPDFLIVGTMKGGSSALTRGVANHPDVFVAPGKELHFFDEHFERGVDWYADRFAAAAPGQVVGEATPRYMNDPAAADRMMATLPEARFIAILRNPADRAYSHYWHNRRRDREKRSFEEAISDGEPPSELFAYIDLGRYVDRLRRIEEKAGPDRLLVALNEDLRHDRAATLRRAWQFIGVDPDRGSVDLQDRPRTVISALKNRRRVRRGQYPPMAPPTRQRLIELYAGEIDALESWLGRDLSGWRR